MHEELETDYLVVGAGAAGMAFTDQLLEHSGSESRITIVDRRHAPGVLAFGSLVHRTDELPDAASRGLDALYSDHVDALVAAVGGGAP